jgi:hypothetical protein
MCSALLCNRQMVLLLVCDNIFNSRPASRSTTGDVDRPLRPQPPQSRSQNVRLPTATPTRAATHTHTHMTSRPSAHARLAAAAGRKPGMVSLGEKRHQKAHGEIWGHWWPFSNCGGVE